MNPVEIYHYIDFDTMTDICIINDSVHTDKRKEVYLGMFDASTKYPVNLMLKRKQIVELRDHLNKILGE
jgi:hypothetical protein